MNTFMLMGLVIQILILPASVMGYISAGQYMRDSSKLIKNDSKANKKMWILVVILPLLYIVLPILGTYIWMRGSDLTFPVWLLMYACMFIGTKKILTPLFAEKKDTLWKFAVMYPWATFLIHIALIMIASRAMTYFMVGF